ncbi:heme ABC transporter ATP-binding protein [Youngiibacter fragilis 232.1]|uniref:Heme ABC transporter ATP-binding protein n=2 Tax=Youngiibacter TaxID=1408818 RepID=V7I6X0_9CLOT|nr:heme ABC transporter ATP-binding protein [Youngiibacter fragilis 232.1]
MPQEMILMKNITKVYPNGFVANKDVTLSVEKGEIHGLVGENGAGKTTLMKILFGIENQEEGQIFIKGQEVKIKDPLHAIALGVGMVHQHFMLVPSLTVAENIVLGMEPKKGIKFDMKKAVEMTREVSTKYNLGVDPLDKVEDISVGQKQKVEILKALIRGAEVLILDEPTAVLTPQETEELFIELKKLRDDGYTVVFISHKLNEVKELCDRVTVLRNGRMIGMKHINEVSEQDISRMMVGRDVILSIEKDKAQPKRVVAKVEHLYLKNSDGKEVIKDVSFTIREGEILGVVGVEGNGQNEVTEVMTGLVKGYTGDIYIDGRNIRGLSIREIREAGISHISEDRMTYGAAGNASVKDNLISDRYYKPDFNRGLLDSKKIGELSSKLVKDYNIKCDSYDQPVRMLSGGNIQKVIVAREFTANMKVIVANQPTRGIDVGATEFIRRKLIEIAREENVGVLLVSADLNEALETSDSIIVMHNGEIVAYFEDASKITEFEIGEYMLGIRKQNPEELRRSVYEH